MSTAFSASLRARPGVPTVERPQSSFTAATYTPPAIPEAPETGVNNPTTEGQKSYLKSLLDPKSATYLGNKYKPAISLAGKELQRELARYGNYSFTEGDMGIVTPQKGDGVGRNYREAYHGERAGAAAAGMLYSRSADQAVGEAWHRLGEQERQIINQYSGLVNEQLTSLSGEFTGVENSLRGLYGEDIAYALANPVLTDPEPAPAAAPAPAPAPGPAPAVAAPAGNAPTGFLGGTAITWKGKPNYTPAQIENRWGKGARLVKPSHRSNVWVVLLPNGGGYATR